LQQTCTSNIEGLLKERYILHAQEKNCIVILSYVTLLLKSLCCTSSWTVLYMNLR